MTMVVLVEVDDDPVAEKEYPLKNPKVGCFGKSGACKRHR